jgi:hypothetical protein
MAKPKTRFGVKVNGVMRELFSVRQLNNGDLLLLLKAAEKMDDGRKVEVQRYSVHRSLKSDPPGRLIKQSLVLEDGAEIYTTQFRLLVEGRFLAVMFSRVCPALASDRYTMQPSARDKVVPLYTGDLGKQTLFYTIVVSDCDVTPQDLTIPGIHTTKVEFSYFNIFVMSGIFVAPAIAKGCLLHTMTSPLIDSGKRHDQTVEINIDSLSTEAAKTHIRAAVWTLAGEMMVRHRDLIATEESPVDAESLALITFAFSRHFAIPLDQATNTRG